MANAHTAFLRRSFVLLLFDFIKSKCIIPSLILTFLTLTANTNRVHHVVAFKLMLCFCCKSVSLVGGTG